MTPSIRCADFIKSFEKCRLTAYMPTPKDRPTIGWGTTGADVHMGMTCSQAWADDRFAHDLAQFGAGVLAALGGAPTTQDEYDAMVSLSYNIGMGNPAKNIPGFLTSSVLRDHKAGDKAGAAKAFGMWVKQAGQTLNGLVRRRAAESHMYQGLRA